MEFRILGPLEVWTEGDSLPLGGIKRRALLAILLLHAGQVVPVDRLVDDVWGGLPPPDADSLLWVHVARLRKTLEPDRPKGAPSNLLLTRAGGYLLQIEPEQLDLEQFERLVAQGRQALQSGAAREAASLLRQALALWRGPALGDLAGEPFARGHIVRLEARRLAALEDRIEADILAGRHGDLVGELEALVVANPLRERLIGQLMLVLYRTGRQVEALDVYRRARQSMADESGLDPDPALQRLERAILTHDPTLEWRPPGGTTVQQAAPHPAPGLPEQDRTPPRATMGVRKTVTVVSIGIGASGIGGEADPELFRHLDDRYLGPVRAAIDAHGGVVQQLTADSVIAVFGVPAAHENDALRAVRAAVDVRAVIERVTHALDPAQALRLSVSAGIETGEVVVFDSSGSQVTLAGALPRRALGLERAAAPADILLGPGTYGLVRDAVEVEEARVSWRDTDRVWRLTAIRPAAAGHSRRLDAPMVGRRRELAMLAHVFERVAADRACHLVTVLGPAGIGKSRLVRELLASVRDRATVLRGRCLDYGEGITFWPVAEALRQAVGTTAGNPEEVRAAVEALLGGERDTELIAEQVAGFLGADEVAAAPQELAWAVRRLLKAIARRRPVVLVLDDLHWAKPALLGLIEHVATFARDAAIVLCCIARPELIDAHPSWGGGRLNATSILLEPLGGDNCAELIDNLLGKVDLAPAAFRRLCEAAEGNPLFVEELIGMLIDDGTLARTGSCWTATRDLTTIPVPPTVSALIAARLDQLGPEERAIIGRGSVIGKLFYRDAVAELSPELARPEMDGHLLALIREDVIYPDQSDLAGMDAFRFRHLLVRDAAYAALPKQQRAELHERFAIWLATTAARVAESDELVAYHLEQACSYRAELGSRDEALVRRAVDRLAKAGQRAGDQWNHRAATSLLARARALLPPDDPASLELMPLLVANLGHQGERQAASELAAAGIELARARGERRLEARLRVERQLPLWTDTSRWDADEARREAEQAIPVLERSRDARGLAAAWLLLGRIELLRLRCEATAAALERAAGYAREAGDHSRFRLALQLLGGCYVVGPVPVPEAIRRCEELGLQAGDNRTMSAGVQGCIACLEAMRGNFGRAWALLDDVEMFLSDLGAMVGWVPWAKHREDIGFVATLERDHATAEHAFRVRGDELERAGLSAAQATEAARLANAVYERRSLDEAIKLTVLSERLATRDDISSQFLWRSVRAKVLARRGEIDEALRLSSEAVELAARTDALNDQADTWMDRAEVLRLAGDGAAGVALEEALDRFTRKGNLVAAARSRSLLDASSD
jgi:predicted ATPase/DNA-binding SARP family transcriptional activator/class 3 adenylate cyclase